MILITQYMYTSEVFKFIESRIEVTFNSEQYKRFTKLY